MNITKFDITIVFTMALAIISMSFVFPALGLADVDASENQIPELDITADAFDFAGEFPQAPSTPTEGTLDLDTSQPIEGSNNVVWLDGDTNDGYELVLLELNNTAQVRINEWNNGNVTQSNQTFDSSTDSFVVVQGEFGVRLTVNKHDPPAYEVRYEVTERPNTGGGIIGGIVGTVGDIAEVLGWFGIVFYWFSVSIIQVSLNVIAAVFSAISYLFSLFIWLSTTYGSVVTAAPSWVGLFVAIPGILLTFTLTKMVVIGIKMLPTT